MFPATTPLWCMVRHRSFMPIHRWFIRRPGITPRERRFRSASELPWERCGAEAGVGTPDGAVTTISPSTTTITSTVMSTEPTTSGVGTSGTGTELPGTGTELTSGNTILSTAVGPHTATGPQQIDLAVLRVGIH